MFTGLIEAVGAVVRMEGGSPKRLTITSKIPIAEVAIGDSVAVDGCCLTVVHKEERGLTFEAATETLKRTTLGDLQPGVRVNLERSLRVGDRLGGHLVMGHIDGVGTVVGKEQRESALYLSIEAPEELAPLIAARGSVSVAGVSLTVTAVTGRIFEVGLIPHTVKFTSLGDLAEGASVNLEADIIARYLERLTTAHKGLS